MSYKKVKGTEDYYPEEQQTRIAIAKILSETAKKYGFQQVDTPGIETTDLLTAKSGDEIKDQLFLLQKKGTEELALRFDLTVPMTRMFVTKQKELAKPVKWYSIDRMWRYEAPQKGRQREFYQLSVELFGSKNPEADANCLNLMLSCMNALNIEKDIVIKINNRKLLEGLLLEAVTQDKLAEVVRIIDKSAKISEIQFAEELKKLGINPQKTEYIKKITKCQGDKKMLDNIKKELNPNALASEGLKELEDTLNLVKSDNILIDLSIARGLAYYTGNVYECHDKEGKYRSIAGGGRYDQLVALFGGDETPATGFAIGMETLTLLLKEKQKTPKQEQGPEYYIAPINEPMIPKALEIAQKLREKTTVDIDLMRRSLSKQFDYANTIKAKKIIIVGEKDLKEGKVTIKELSTGKEEKVSVESF